MKKIAKILSVCLIIIAAIVVIKVGFKVGLKYSENTQIDINIGKEFNIEDIKAITNEVFPKQSVMIQQVELYKDMVQVTVKNASDDQINNLNSKINEKYGISNKMSDILVTNNANTSLKSLAKPYIIPVAITFGIILIYAIIRLRKIGTIKVIYQSVITIILPQLLLFSIYAIFRLPINRITAIASLMLYVITSYIFMSNGIKENNSIKLKKAETESKSTEKVEA